jgi:hypothetical protein
MPPKDGVLWPSGDLKQFLRRAVALAMFGKLQNYAKQGEVV